MNKYEQLPLRYATVWNGMEVWQSIWPKPGTTDEVENSDNDRMICVGDNSTQMGGIVTIFTLNCSQTPKTIPLEVAFFGHSD